MKRRVIKIGVLVVIFAAALVISSLVVNRGDEDEIVDMGAPTLPRISFVVDGKNVNMLFGYVDEMDITAMRDTITTLESDGSLSMNLEADGNKISKIQYEVYSLDGKETYKTGEVTNITEDQAMKLELDDALDESVQEAVLRVVLTGRGPGDQLLHEDRAPG